MPKFSVHLDYLFQDRPLLQRIDAAAACGFKAVEGRFPQVPAADFKAALARNNLRALGINSPMGRAGEFGLCALPGREADWDVAFAQALDYVVTIGATAIHCMAGTVDPDKRAAAEKAFVGNLTRSADLAAAKGIKLYIEPINPRDQPNYFLAEVEHAADIIAKVGKPNVWLQYDLYHVQIVGGDLIRRFENHQKIIGHIQCSQVPTRCEPDDDGEINYPFVFGEIDRLGYSEWIGCEYRPRTLTEAGLGWGRNYGLIAPGLTPD
ncbi:MAG: TIM barrel protein [Pseudolabrys sp.]|nr:TIM barrel protein [Pseudolabrys sp.]MDP2296195.1 TIM barrel protein [Pseudolabrys sp.]